MRKETREHLPAGGAAVDRFPPECASPSSRRCRRARTNSTGFTLIEIVVVLVIVGIMLSMALSLTKVLQTAKLTAATTSAIQHGDDALVAFVTLYKRLPCPANGAFPPGDPNYGVEQGDGAGNCTGNEAGGVIPWATLHLGAPDVTDGYGGVLTYRVHPALTQANGLDLTYCDVAGGATTDGGYGSRCLGSPPGAPCAAATSSTTCTSPLEAIRGRGLKVTATSGGTVINDPASSGGAAYVLVSHGANAAGGYTAQGVPQGTTGTVGTDEAVNVATAALVAAYVDRAVVDGTDTLSHFDDVLSHPTIMQVVLRAGAGPRVHN